MHIVKKHIRGKSKVDTCLPVAFDKTWHFLLIDDDHVKKEAIYFSIQYVICIVINSSPSVMILFDELVLNDSKFLIQHTRTVGQLTCSLCFFKPQRTKDREGTWSRNYGSNTILRVQFQIWTCNLKVQLSTYQVIGASKCLFILLYQLHSSFCSFSLFFLSIYNEVNRYLQDQIFHSTPRYRWNQRWLL